MAKPEFFTPQDKNQFPGLIGASGTAQTGTVQAKPITFTDSGSKTGIDGFILGGTVSTDAVETTGFNGGSVSVGTAEVEITFTGVTQGILVQADHDNSNTVYIGGTGMDVTGALAVSRLEPGDAISMDLNDASAPVYAIGGTTAQKVWKAALT